MQIPSPRESLAGCVWLPRILAKARQLQNGALPPDYAARFCDPTGVDGQFLAHFTLTRDDVVRLARLPDAEVAAWFLACNGAGRIEEWNRVALNLGRPGFPMAERFPVAASTSYKHVYAPGMTTVFELLEADDKSSS